MQSVDRVFEHFSPGTLHSIVNQVVHKVTVSQEYIIIKFNTFGISLLATEDKTRQKGYCAEYLEFKYPIKLFKKRGRVLIITPHIQKTHQQVDYKLLNAVVAAFKWAEEIKRRGITITAFAKREGKDRSYMCRLLRICYLAPDIIQAILNGTQSRTLKLENFTREEIPYLWEEQRKKFQFNSI